MPENDGTLYIVATPIGNLGDISHRALDVLSKVGALACEDTRITLRIFQRYEIKRPKTVFSCHEHNENRVVNRIMGLLESGVSVALCTDAGVPGVSDPGYLVMSTVIANGGDVFVIPGPSAVSTALLLSGLPMNTYTFKGFSPPTQGKRAKFINMEAESSHTLVFFESPRRVGRFLSESLEILGNRRAAVCIELTKMFEQIHRGTLEELAAQFADKTIKGEVTVVIEGLGRKARREASHAGE